MIKNFVQAKQHHYIISSLLIVVGLTALLLWLDEVYTLGTNKQYIFLVALLALTASFAVFMYKGYVLYKNLQNFLPTLWSSNIISNTTQYLIANQQGKVLVTNDKNLIDFCNNKLVNLLPTNLSQSPVEFPIESITVKLYKLDDLYKPAQQLRNCILITTMPTAATTTDLSARNIIQSLQVPAYLTDETDKINDMNLHLLQLINIDNIKTGQNIYIKTYNNSQIISLYHNEHKIDDFLRIKIYDNGQEQCFLLVKNETLFSLNYYPISTCTIDRTTNILSANNTFYELLNLEQNSKLQSLNDYLDEDSKSILENYFEAKDLNKTYPFEIKFENNKLIGLVYVVYVEKENSYFCHIIDITKYKNIEMNFIHSQKMQAVGQLAGGIAHDFNNLLTAMLGFCDLLLIKHPAGDPSFADIMQIKQNANRAANLVRQLLAISRKQVLRPEILDLTSILEEVANLIRRLIGENITLKMNHSKDLMSIKADHGQLEQVIMNLAVNARDAIGSEKGTLTINTSNAVITGPESINKNFFSPLANEEITSGKYVLIEVIDTGCGISKEILNQIFEPFFSTKDIGAGTGLGLSTVYGIIKQTGGYLYVQSAPGKGAKFYIYLKAVGEKESASTKQPHDHDAETTLTQPDLTGNSTILLVEDEAPVRMFSAHALSNKGYKVIEAESGEEAFVIMKEKGDEIALIITDVIMPGITGPAFIKEIQKTYPEVKVIFMSGYAEEAFSRTYGVDGNFNFLSKPFTLKQLASKVKETLTE